MRPRVVVDRGMIVVTPRREVGAGAQDVRDVVTEIGETLSLCPPSGVHADDEPGDGHRHVILPNVPVRALAALLELLEGEGWVPLVPPRRATRQPNGPVQSVRLTPKDEARVREARALLPIELQLWAATGVLPADLDP